MPGVETSPYACAHVARIPSAQKSKLSATLVARQLGALCIKVTFHRIPCVSVGLTFFEMGQSGSKGALVSGPLKTGKNGVAMVAHLVPAGLYVLELEGQSPTVVSTVADMRKPFVVVTPIDRPYFDAGEWEEFDDELLDLEDVADGERGIAAAEDELAHEGMMTVSFSLENRNGFDNAYPIYRLRSDDGRYARELSARDDLVEGDDWLQLRFEGLKPKTRYTLERLIAPGHQNVVFENVDYDDIVDAPNESGDAMKDHRYAGIRLDRVKLAPEKWG